jgi:hypothetical protein
MRFVKFIYTNDWGYVQEAYTDYAHQMLGMFLTDEVNDIPDRYKEWALDPEQTYACGNIIFLDKVGDRIVVSYDPVMNPSEEEIAANGYKFLKVEKELSILREEFIHVIDEWVKCQINHFNEIWIKNDNGTFWIEGVK